MDSPNEGALLLSGFVYLIRFGMYAQDSFKLASMEIWIWMRDYNGKLVALGSQFGIMWLLWMVCDLKRAW